MVTTRSQSNRNRELNTETMDRSSDNESESSFPDVLFRDQIADLDADDLLHRQQSNDNLSIDRRFNEINRQIGDLTNIVLTLTNQFASVNGEGNRLNTATASANSRSDTCLRSKNFWIFVKNMAVVNLKNFVFSRCFFLKEAQSSDSS